MQGEVRKTAVGLVSFIEINGHVKILYYAVWLYENATARHNQELAKHCLRVSVLTLSLNAFAFYFHGQYQSRSLKCLLLVSGLSNPLHKRELDLFLGSL